MSVSKATAARRAAMRALRTVELDLERTVGAGLSVAELLQQRGEARVNAWQRGINHAIERVRAVRNELARKEH